MTTSPRPTPATDRPSDQPSDRSVARYEMVLLRTYRYLRIGVIGLILFLATSVVMEIERTGSVLGSISAYYYTPVHSVFVASLCAVGVSLVVYRGFSDTEDVVLNAAGFLVFVVALVPKHVDAQDQIIDVLPVSDATILANLVALLVVTFAAMVTTASLMTRQPPVARSDPHEAADRKRAVLAFRVLAAGYAGAVGVVLLRRDFVFTRAHWTAAVLFFVLIAAVVVINAVRLARQQHRTWQVRWTQLGNRYGWILVAMVLDAAVLFALGEYGLDLLHDWILWLEASLIGIFAVYWAMQTAEHWNDRVKNDPTVEGVTDAPSSQQIGL